MILKQTNTILDISNVHPVALIALLNDIQNELAYRDAIPPMTGEMYKYLEHYINDKWQYGHHEGFDKAYAEAMKEFPDLG